MAPPPPEWTSIHPAKTRLVAFESPGKRPGSKLGSFNTLGFQLYWAKSREGNWVPKKKTSPQRPSRRRKNITQWRKDNRYRNCGREAPNPISYAERAAQLLNTTIGYNGTCHWTVTSPNRDLCKDRRWARTDQCRTPTCWWSTQLPLLRCTLIRLEQFSVQHEYYPVRPRALG